MNLSTHSIEDPVDIESGVDNKGRAEDLVPKITSIISLGRFPRKGERTLGRVSDVLVHVAGVLAVGSLLVKFSHVGLTVGGKKS